MMRIIVEGAKYSEFLYSKNLKIKIHTLYTKHDIISNKIYNNDRDSTIWFLI